MNIELNITEHIICGSLPGPSPHCSEDEVKSPIDQTVVFLDVIDAACETEKPSVEESDSDSVAIDDRHAGSSSETQPIGCTSPRKSYNRDTLYALSTSPASVIIPTFCIDGSLPYELTGERKTRLVQPGKKNSTTTEQKRRTHRKKSKSATSSDSCSDSQSTCSGSQFPWWIKKKKSQSNSSVNKPADKGAQENKKDVEVRKVSKQSEQQRSAEPKPSQPQVRQSSTKQTKTKPLRENQEKKPQPQQQKQKTIARTGDKKQHRQVAKNRTRGISEPANVNKVPNFEQFIAMRHALARAAVN